MLIKLKVSWTFKIITSLTLWPIFGGEKKVIQIVSILVYSSQKTESIHYVQIKSYRLKKKVLQPFWIISMVTKGVNYVIWHFSLFLTTGHSHDIQRKKDRKSWFSSTFQCHMSRSHTEWVSPPQSRSLLNVAINPPCGFSSIQAKDWAGLVGLRLSRQQGMSAVPALPLGL